MKLYLYNTFIFFLRLASWPTRKWLFSTILLGMLSALLEMVNIYFISKTSQDLNSTHALHAQILIEATSVIVLLAAVNILKTFSIACSSSCLSSDVTKAVFTSALSASSSERDPVSSLNVGKNITRELCRSLFAPIITLPSAFLSCLFIVAGSVYTSGLKLVALFLTALTISSFVSLLTSKMAQKSQKEAIKSEESLEYNCLNLLNYADEFNICNTTDFHLSNLFEAARAARYKVMKSQALLRIPSQITQLITIFTILLFLLAGYISISELLVLFVVLQRGNLSSSSFISSINSIYASEPLIAELRDKLSSPSAFAMKENKLSSTFYDFDFSNPLTVQSIEFCAPLTLVKSNIPSSVAARNNCFSIKSSSGLIAFTAPSGAGKTTIMKQICGLIYPDFFDHPPIIFNCYDANRIRSLDLKFLKGYYSDHNRNKRVGSIFSNLSDFPGLTETHLISLFDWNREFNLLWPSIESLDDWLQLKLDNASFGENARFSLIRAYLFKGYWYFFDEPTNGLDDQNKKNAIEALIDLSKRSLVICITHDEYLISHSSAEITISGFDIV